jgi:small subunit ribosomal protein S16
MSVVIRLMRAGAKKRPFYRMVAADSRRQRDGRFLEILGHYNPLSQPFELVVHKDRVERWLARGAQPSDQAASLLRRLGIAMHRASPPKKKAAAEPAAPAKKAAKKRAVQRKVSERKQRKLAAKKGAKKGAKKAAKKTTKT